MFDAKTAALTSVALLAFAANSLLTRSALGAPHIDAAGFTALRLSAGAVALGLMARAQSGSWTFVVRRDAVGPAALFMYAAPFSFAYVRIGAAIGALVLFGAVQLTMIGWGLARGERPTVAAWIGIAIALAGMTVLVLPTAVRPDPVGVVLMGIAGAAWAAYSITGKRHGDPIATNAHSFLWSAFPALVLAAVTTTSATPTTARGVLLAALSGAVTSGIGYAIWYRALRGLSVTHAAVSQLSVPVIAASGAALVLGEHVGVRLVVSGAAVLIGVSLVLSSRRA